MAWGWQNSCRPRSCNYLQNVDATTYKKFLQFYAKKACKKHSPVLIRQFLYRIIFHCFPLLCQRIIYYRVEYYFHLLRSLPEDLCNNLHLMQIRKRFDHLSALLQSISVIFHLYSLVVLYWQNSLPNRHLYSLLYLNSYFSKSHNSYYHDLSCIFPVLF